MVLIIGASCVNRAVTRTPYILLKQYNILGHTYSKSGLNLNHRSGAGLHLQQLLEKSPLKQRNDIIIWHDLLNNSVTAHKSNRNNPLSVNELKHILTKYSDQIIGLVCCNRFGAPDLFNSLCDLKIAPVISVRRHLISTRKKKSQYYKAELDRIHPASRIEVNLLRTVIQHQRTLNKLILKKRSKTRKRKNKKKSTKDFF